MAEGVQVVERSGVALASLIARRGRLEGLAAAIRDGWGAELPLRPRVVEGIGASFIWAGRERWLVTSDASAGDLVAALRARVDGLGAVCEQSDGRVLLRVSGPGARATLARGVPIDLHPSVFSPGTTAITLAAHVGCQIWQVDDSPAYDLAVPRSFAASCGRWLDAAAAVVGKDARG